MKINNKILLGHILGLFGVKGWIKVFSHTRPRTQILNYRQWYLGEQGDRLVQLEDGRAHKTGVIAKLAGIDDRDSAVGLLDNKIWVDANELPELAADEYYWYQLVGLQVIDTANRVLGEITSLFETGANDVMVVQAEDGSEHLLPYVMQQVIKEIDLVNNKMIVDWDVEF